MTLLTWKPPTLIHPITISVSNANHNLQLDPTKDYILHITALGGLQINGGHHVVLIGGTINIPTWGSKPGTNFPNDVGGYPTGDPVWKTLHHGVPPNGDFVPAAMVGMAYVSPGYN